MSLRSVHYYTIVEVNVELKHFGTLSLLVSASLDEPINSKQNHLHKR